MYDGECDMTNSLDPYTGNCYYCDGAQAQCVPGCGGWPAATTTALLGMSVTSALMSASCLSVMTTHSVLAGTRSVTLLMITVPSVEETAEHRMDAAKAAMTMA
eukprot:TRINITY_DN15824_c0_g1_i1.p1 TRINITY_DN15824_c0_g1~~TRINITY_DN15824_c0_g1_i1.p1  ORF type:complete len:103 (+),score=27.46 TRINITY_DN15824_c0_g1_i1:221-529(+)